MDRLDLAATEETPTISFDGKTGALEISGRSIPSDANEFYTPVLEWIQAYAKNPTPATRVIFKFDYFNTATAKKILDLLYALEKIRGVTIEWYFDEDDEDMEEAGQEFAELVKIPFAFKSA
jgi:hypothetical protein